MDCEPASNLGASLRSNNVATNDGTSLYYPTYFCGASSGTKYFYNYKSARPSWLCTLAVLCVPHLSRCCETHIASYVSTGVLVASSAVTNVRPRFPVCGRLRVVLQRRRVLVPGQLERGPIQQAVRPSALSLLCRHL